MYTSVCVCTRPRASTCVCKILHIRLPIYVFFKMSAQAKSKYKYLKTRASKLYYPVTKKPETDLLKTANKGYAILVEFKREPARFRYF